MPSFVYTEKFSPHLQTEKTKASAKLMKKLNIQIQTMSGYMSSTKKCYSNPRLDDPFFSLRAVPSYISSILSHRKVWPVNDLFSLNKAKADKTQVFLECLFYKKNFQ